MLNSSDLYIVHSNYCGCHIARAIFLLFLFSFSEEQTINYKQTENFLVSVYEMKLSETIDIPHAFGATEGGNNFAALAGAGLSIFAQIMFALFAGTL